MKYLAIAFSASCTLICVTVLICNNRDLAALAVAFLGAVFTGMTGGTTRPKPKLPNP